MDNLRQPTTMFSKNTMIIILLSSLIVLLSFFGINILIIVGNYVKDFTGFISSNLVANGAIKGIDVTNDAINDVDEKKIHESFIEYAPYQMNEPAPSDGESIIQKSIATSKNSWCLVGNKTGLNSCKNISAEEKCSSGQLYPSQFECLSQQF